MMLVLLPPTSLLPAPGSSVLCALAWLLLIGGLGVKIVAAALPAELVRNIPAAFESTLYTLRY